MGNNILNDIPDEETEGHVAVPVDEDATADQTPPPPAADGGNDDDGDDTEGHKLYRYNGGVEFD